MDALNSPTASLLQAKPMLTKINFPREALLIAGLQMVLFNFADPPHSAYVRNSLVPRSNNALDTPGSSGRCRVDQLWLRRRICCRTARLSLWRRRQSASDDHYVLDAVDAGRLSRENNWACRRAHHLESDEPSNHYDTSVSHRRDSGLSNAVLPRPRRFTTGGVVRINRFPSCHAAPDCAVGWIGATRLG